MNRRKFVWATSASIALMSHRALAQRSSRNSSTTVLTSELTGGEVDVSGTSLEMVNQHIDTADGSEHFHFAMEDGGQFDIIMWPQATADAADFVQSQINMFLAINPDSEILAEDEFEDGGWVAFNVNNVGYYEYQLNAYPGHDLVILFNAPAETFETIFEQAQAVHIDGFPPFLFAEESAILSVAATQVTTNSTSSRSSRGSATGEATNSRSSRSSRGTSETTTETPETRSSRSSSRSGSSAAADPVTLVREHRDTFLDSYDEFYTLLQSAADETTPEDDVDQAFVEMVSIAKEWQGYPEDAALVIWESGTAELETAYLDWADLVGELGYTFEDFYNRLASVDDFLGVYDAWVVADDELLAILGSGLRFFRRSAVGRHDIARSLKTERLTT